MSRASMTIAVEFDFNVDDDAEAGRYLDELVGATQNALIALGFDVMELEVAV